MSTRTRREGKKQNLEIWTTSGPDDQIGSAGISYRGGCIAPFDGVTRYILPTANGIHVRNLDGTFYTKFNIVGYAIAWDGTNFFLTTSTGVTKLDASMNVLLTATISGCRKITTDDTHGYITRAGTNTHGITKIQKSDLSVVSSNIGASSSDNDKFSYPFSIIVVGSLLYITDSYNFKVKAFTKDLVYDSVKFTHSTYTYGLATDGTNFFLSDATALKKYDSSWNLIKSVSVGTNNISSVVFNANVLFVLNSGGAQLKLYNSSDALEYISTPCGPGDGSASLFDPVITYSGPSTGYWQMDDGNIFPVASGANISWNGFSGYTFKTAGPHKAVFKGASLANITGIDANTDSIASIKNLFKSSNLTLLKLYSNNGIEFYPSILNYNNITDVRIYVGWTAQQYTDVLLSAWNARSNYTYASGIVLHIGVPTGILGTEPPVVGESNSNWAWNAVTSRHDPLTGQAVISDLSNDFYSERFKTWSVTQH